MFNKENDTTFEYVNLKNLDHLIESLPANQYIMRRGFFGVSFIVDKANDEKVFRLENEVTRKLQRELDMFFDKEHRARLSEKKILNKRGIILYGPPGTGKTSMARYFVQQLIEKHDALVFGQTDPDDVNQVINLVRSTDPDRPIVVIWDEFDQTVREYEHNLLRLLDGQNSANNLIFIGMLNDIAEVPERLFNRPSRFSLVLEVGLPDAETRENFLKLAYPEHQDSEELLELVRITEGLSLDHVKEAGLKLWVHQDTAESIRDYFHDLLKLSKQVNEAESEIDFDNVRWVLKNFGDLIKIAQTKGIKLSEGQAAD